VKREFIRLAEALFELGWVITRRSADLLWETLVVENVKCFLCDTGLGDRPEEHWCFGCKKYVCDMHTTLYGRHKPEDHDEDDE
jgi:hypothetical protein